MKAVVAVTLVSALALFVPRAQAQDGKNPCQEGLFLDRSLESPICRPLMHPDRGFDWDAFNAEAPAQTFSLTSEQCSLVQLRRVLDDADAAGGGLVDISACPEIEMTGRIVMPSNTILQGGGPGATILKAPADSIKTTDRDSLGQLVTIFNKRNVVLRDLTVDGGDVTYLLTAVLFSDNVLLERVELARAINNGIDITHSGRVGVRFSEVHSTSLFNGISSKDCYPSRSSDAYTLQSCIDNRTAWAGTYAELGGTLGEGTFFTSSYSVHSNVMRDNMEYCLAFHARLGEVAGNFCEAESAGFKFPDAQDIYVHNNLIQNGRLWGIHVYPPTLGLYPQQQYLFQNKIYGNGWQGIRVNGTQAFVMYNDLQGNMTCVDGCPVDGVQGVEEIRIVTHNFPDGSLVEPEVFICENSREDEIADAGHMNLSAVTYDSAERCFTFGSYPLELTELEVIPGGETALLRWKTGREFENAGFAVDQSFEGGDFMQIGFVDGFGTSDGPHAYSFRVNGLEPGMYAFRLRQQSFSGVEIATPPVEVAVTVPLEHASVPGEGFRVASLFPNPFRDRVTLQLQTERPEQLRVELVDLLGRPVRMLWDGAAPAGETSLRLQVDDLPAGMYWLRVRGEDTEIVRALARR